MAHYYEIYLLSIFEVLLSCNSLMLSKLKFEAQSQVASFSKFDSNETCSANLQRIKTKLNNQIKKGGIKSIYDDESWNNLP